MSRVDGAPFGAEVTSSPYTISWDTSALSNGSTHTLAARARDDLVDRVDRILRDEADRFAGLLEGKVPEAEAVARLHTAIDAVRRAS